MITSPTNPPRVPSHGVYWERQPDPFHASAILPALEQAGFQPANPEVLHHGDQCGGWMLIDWAENPIGWVPDGTECPDHDQEFEFREGPYKRMCAYPKECPACNGTGAEFPGNPMTLKCEECDGSGRARKPGGAQCP